MTELATDRHARIEADLEHWFEDGDLEPTMYLAVADVRWLLEERNRLLILVAEEFWRGVHVGRDGPGFYDDPNAEGNDR